MPSWNRRCPASNVAFAKGESRNGGRVRAITASARMAGVAWFNPGSLKEARHPGKKASKDASAHGFVAEGNVALITARVAPYAVSFAVAGGAPDQFPAKTSGSPQ